jgi:hypothetical protein
VVITALRLVDQAEVIAGQGVLVPLAHLVKVIVAVAVMAQHL